MQKGVLTKSAYKKMLSGHPWLTGDDFIDRSLLPKRPSAFYLGDHWWMCSPESFIKLRRLGPVLPGWMKNSKFNYIHNADQFHAYFGKWLIQHLQKTLENKIAALKIPSEEHLCLRWIFSENDLIPGLIVDVFNDTVVAQLNAAPIEVFWYQIRLALQLAYKNIFNRSCEVIELRNSGVRKNEGLDIIPVETTAEPKLIKWNHFSWLMTPGSSQKTGAYFDQRINHTEAALFAQKLSAKSAWDLCSYQGGFTLHLLKQGLTVTAVDQSASAIATLKENVSLNNLPTENLHTATEDVFKWLEVKKAQSEMVDLIVLDPPSFVKQRKEIASALRGYKELNTAALSLINPGGGLVSCVCSHHISEKDYEQVLKESAQIAKRKIQIEKMLGPSADHAPAPAFKEGRYLQAWYLEVR